MGRTFQCEHGLFKTDPKSPPPASLPCAVPKSTRSVGAVPAPNSLLLENTRELYMELCPFWSCDLLLLPVLYITGSQRVTGANSLRPLFCATAKHPMSVTEPDFRDYAWDMLRLGHRSNFHEFPGQIRTVGNYACHSARASCCKCTVASDLEEECHPNNLFFY